MNTTATVILIAVLAVVAVAAAVLAARSAKRRRNLRSRFGPEYDRAVERYGGRREAEKHLSAREREVRELRIRPLDPAARERYAAEWTELQERFVDSPDAAVQEADELITRLMRERGYPTGAHDKRMELLSVEHGRTLDHYRRAHDIARRSEAGEVGTEDLRQAVIHHRALFDDLLGRTSEARHGTPRAQPGTASGTTVPDRHDDRPAEWGATEAPATEGTRRDPR